MNTSPFPNPNGTPASTHDIQWTGGRAVQENQNSPIGISMPPMHIGRTKASGGIFPVTGSGGCFAMRKLRTSGSENTARAIPVPIPK
ncbi:unnamed protein product [Aspergillus oryzae]|uniref:Unnamed protein product n=2 Tax=Aspergillus oryzae TaxID=5062 RepID=A0AAN4YVV1_ASPOZ|nr:unnamed protein product [Aspergillus oryzae]GMF87496.1 unnamed protein product [Aspergillus oryzae]GMG08218.1 unnamed protein product [Aspergillus oryzae]GMG37853.1 unnamed protein product [Aspergillus oryzae]GMG53852.1 unnamed protein product [Aspergillus oryzae var. brunneus]